MPEEIETETKPVDDEFIGLKKKFDKVNDVVTELNKQQKIATLIDDVIDKKNQFQNLGTEDIWIEETYLIKMTAKRQLKFQKTF